MKRIFYLSTCSTCKRIIKEIKLPENYERQDIKKDPLSAAQLEELQKLAGSYETLFSRRAQLYKERNLKDENLDEDDIKKLLLEHYTFLKRPVLVDEGAIFIGNSKKTVAAAKDYLEK